MVHLQSVAIDLLYYVRDTITVSFMRLFYDVDTTVTQRFTNVADIGAKRTRGCKWTTLISDH